MFFQIFPAYYTRIWLGLILFSVSFFQDAPSVHADETNRLQEITVIGEVLTPVKQVGDSLYTGSMVTREGLELKGISAASSIYEAVDLLPGVSVETMDPYGLSRKNTRFRGIKGMFGSITVEGMPDYGIMPLGPRESIFDTENLKGVAMYQGASPTALGTGNGNKGGSIELFFRRPEKRPEISFKQAFGTDRFSRTFVRADSGELPTRSRFFASYSYTDANKWKGPGELGPRNHVDVGFVQDLAEFLEVEGFFSFNDADQDSFRPLIYRETKDLGRYYRLDYNEDLTGSPARDRYYFRYNTRSATNRDFRFILRSVHAGPISLSVKPYYSNEDAWRTETIAKLKGGATKYFMLKKITDLDRVGVIPEVVWDASPISLAAGYWFESAALDKYVKKSIITPEGLKDLGYAYYSKSDGRGYVHSPYLKVSGEHASFRWQAGIKYFYYEEPASRGYTTNRSGMLVEQPDLKLDEQDWDVWLPSAGVGYEIADGVEIYCNYGRTYVRPYMFVPITSLYIENRAKFNSAGMVLQDIFDQWDMETSDNIDVGVRLRQKAFSVHSVFFYQKHHDILVNAYDPSVGLNYYQNDGEARGIGFEVEASTYLPWGITLFFDPTYTDLQFTDDLKRSGNKVKIDGKQLPDTPKWLLKGGVTYTWEDFEITSLVTYMSKRYGDALHEEAIPSHAVVDLSIRYYKDRLWELKNISANLEFRNILDSHHIGVIDLFDDGVAGKTNYYSAAPFSVVFSLNATW